MVSTARHAAPARRRRRALQLPRSAARRRSRPRTSATSSPSRATTTTRRARRWSLRQDEELALTLPRLRRSPAPHDPVDRSGRGPLAEHRHVASSALILRYTRLLPDGASVVVTPSIGYDTHPRRVAVRRTPIDGQRRAPGSTRCARRYRRKVAAATTLSLGLDMQARSLGRRPRRLAQPAAARRRHRRVRPAAGRRHQRRPLERHDRSTPRPTSTAEIGLGRLTLTPGLRFEPTLIDGSPVLPAGAPARAASATRASTLPEPRGSIPATLPARAQGPALGAEPAPHRRVPRHASASTLTAGGGLYHQPPDPEDLSPVFGNPHLGCRARCTSSGGVTFKLRPTLTLEVVGFYKRLWDLVSRNELPTPPLAQALTQDADRPHLRRPAAAAPGAAAAASSAGSPTR